MAQPRLDQLRHLLQLKERPEGTISLSSAIAEPIKTLDTYVFTDSIRKAFEQILETIVTGRAGGFWIQAEWGVGKTHFLSALTCLLENADPTAWRKVHDDVIRGYEKRLESNRFFTVVINLRGEGSTKEAEDDLLAVLEEYIEEALIERGERDRVKMGVADELITWHDNVADDSLKTSINRFSVEKIGKNVDELEKEAFADVIRAYCKKNDFKPHVTSSTKARIQHIYEQVLGIGYSGLCFVVDEFATWQRRHPKGTKEFNQDEEVLETLAWRLPKEANLNIYTIVASVEPPSAKLKLDRFKEILLLAGKNEREFDVIVAQRLRDLREEKRPEIEQYYSYYLSQFDFFKVIDKDYFFQIFPFHPRCFDIIRRITSKAHTTRAGIAYLYDVLEATSIGLTDSLITTDKLLVSSTLSNDLRPTIRAAFDAYEMALSAIDNLSFDDREEVVARQITTTLFLWWVAYPQMTKGLSLRQVAEILLVPDDERKGEEKIESIIIRLRDLRQILFTREKGARFNATTKEEPSSRDILSKLTRKVTPEQVTSAWEKTLVSGLGFAEDEALFSRLYYDKFSSQRVQFRKIEYPGEVILRQAWHPEDAAAIKESSHFRIIILAHNQEIDVNEIGDPRIAVVIPSVLSEGLKTSLKELTAAEEFERNIHEHGSHPDEDRDWIRDKKRKALAQVLKGQIKAYAYGKVQTQQALGIDESSVFSERKLDRVFASIVDTLLNNVYVEQPFNSTVMRKVFTGSEAKKVFDGFFKTNAAPKDKSACENFGHALGLSGVNSSKFVPVETNKAFNFFKDALKQHGGGEIEVSELLREMEKPPRGVIKELATLLLLCFVGSTSSVELRLKDVPYWDKTRLRAITSWNIADIVWSQGLIDSLQYLAYTKQVVWDDIVPYGRAFLPDLKLAAAPLQIQQEGTRLLEAVARLDTETIKTHLESLASSFGEKNSEQFAVLKRIRELERSKNFKDFYDTLKTLYVPAEGTKPDESAFQRDMSVLSDLKTVAKFATVLVDARKYINDVDVSEISELETMRVSLQQRLTLAAVLDAPQSCSAIQTAFFDFRKAYKSEYQIHHREYYNEIERLNNCLSPMQTQIAAFVQLASLEMDSVPQASHYDHVRARLTDCTNQDFTALDAVPQCTVCGIPLSSEPPTNEVADLIRALNFSFQDAMINLHRIIKPLEGMDEKQELGAVLEILESKDATRLSEILTNDLIIYVQQCIDKANIKWVRVNLLEEFTKAYTFIEEKDISTFVGGLRAELEKAFRQAKEDYPGKTIRLELKKSSASEES